MSLGNIITIAVLLLSLIWFLYSGKSHFENIDRTHHTIESLDNRYVTQKEFSHIKTDIQDIHKWVHQLVNGNKDDK